MKKLLLILNVILFSLSILFTTSCLESQTNVLEATFKLEENTKFGGINILTSIDDILSLGFNYGDSVDCILDNGQEKIDVPFYNGYYSNRGETLVCAYPGYTSLHFTNNNGANLYEELDASSATKITIKLNTKGKYNLQQEVMNIVYSCDRSKFDSDVIFANYRFLSGGNIKTKMFYRGVSPVNDCYNRASYADNLIEEDGISFILDLSDSEDDLSSYASLYDYNNSYFKTLKDNNKVILLDLSSNYASTSFKEGLGVGIKEMMKHTGSVYIHCTEGKDRTGFVCLLFEALCGATYEEVENDYMITYDNYYHINKIDDLVKYNAVKNLLLYDMVKYLTGEADASKFSDLNLELYATTYLQECGLTNEEINNFKIYLSE